MGIFDIHCLSLNCGKVDTNYQENMSVNPLHLFAEDPYHPPGYAGYVPQKMYRHAGTYGRTTHDILKDERVPYKITRTATSHTFDMKRMQVLYLDTLDTFQFLAINLDLVMSQKLIRQ